MEPTQVGWHRWIDMAKSQRVVPLLHRVVTAWPSDLPSSDIDSVHSIDIAVMGSIVRSEHQLLRVAERLSVAGISFAVLKGSATAHVDYDDPALRQYADVDLLVLPEEFGRTQDLLREDGWAQAYTLPRHHEPLTHAVTLRKPGWVELDLHQRIAHRALGLRIPTQLLLADSVSFEVAGTTLWALSRADRLIHAAVHASASRGAYRRLSGVADVLVLSHLQANDAAAVLQRAESWCVRSLVEHAIRSAYDAARLPLPAGFAGAMSRPIMHRDRLIDHAYLSERRRPATEELAYLRLMGTWRDRTSYLLGYLFPDEDYTHKRGRHGLLAQSRYLWSRLRSIDVTRS